MTKNSIKIFNAIINYQKKYKNIPRVLYLAKVFEIGKKDIENYLFELDKYGFIKIENNSFQILKEKISDPPTEIKKITEKKEKEDFFKKPENINIDKNFYNSERGISFNKKKELPEKIITIEKTDNVKFSKNQGNTIKQSNKDYGKSEKIFNEIKKNIPELKNATITLKFLFFKLLTLIPIIIGMHVSIFFTRLWFDDFFKNFYIFYTIKISLEISLFIVISSFISWQLFIKYKRKKEKKCIIFFLVWLMTISFSITTGINGQLKLETTNKISKNDNKINENNDLLKNELLNKKINRDNEDLNKAQIKKDFFEKEMYKYAANINDSTADRIMKINRIKDIKKDIKNVKDEIDSLKKEINKNEDEIKKQLETGKKIKAIQEKDFFVWMENIFTFQIKFFKWKWNIKIKADIIKFVIYLFLASFADIIPPIFFSELLFSKEE